MSQQQRMILAVVLSIIFFVVYDKFFMPKPQLNKMENNISKTSTTQVNNVQQKSAPHIGDASKTSVISKTPSGKAHIAKSPITKSSIISTIKAKDFIIEIDSLGRIAKYSLKGKKYLKSDGSPTVIIDESQNLKPLELRFSDNNTNVEAFLKPYEADKKSIELKDSATLTLTQKLTNLTITKKIIFKKDGTYTLNIQLSKPVEFFVSNGEHPVAERDQFVFKGVIVEKSDDTLETFEEGDDDTSVAITKAKYLAASDKYYTTVFYDFKHGLNTVVSIQNKIPQPFIKVNSDKVELNGYIGPKEYDKLYAIDPELTNVIEYGFFTFIARPMFLFLKYINSVIGNWGWTIVIATILIKLFLFPLTFKGMVSMNKMKELAPKMKEIREKYKGEPQKLNAKMMELYKKHRVNPMGGCLPMLLQIPVFFAIYRVLLNAVDLKSEPWILWIHDLSVKDPYFVLPILMGATMFWQQKITPATYNDPMQEKIMKFLPLIFTFFFVAFPAGLTLYWFVNNLFTVGQQYYVNAIFAKAKAQKA